MANWSKMLCSALVVITISTGLNAQENTTNATTEEASTEEVKQSNIRKFIEGFKLEKYVRASGWYSNQRPDAWGGKQELGFVLSRYFSTERGIWGAFRMEAAATRYDNFYSWEMDDEVLPNYNNKKSTFGYEIEDLYFKYSGYNGGKIYVQAGHFSIPSGLEENLNPDQELIQLSSARNIGFTHDWGISLGGMANGLQYRLAVTSGTGMRLMDIGKGSFLVSGRVGSAPGSKLMVGFSGSYGKVIDPVGVARGMNYPIDVVGDAGDIYDSTRTWFGETAPPENDLINRWRVGADFIWPVGPVVWSAQFSYGQDYNQTVVNSLVQLDYNIASTVRVIGQIQFMNQTLRTFPDHQKDVFATAGVNWQAAPWLKVSAAYRFDLDSRADLPDESLISTSVQVKW